MDGDKYVCMRARKQTIIVDFFLQSSDNVYNVFLSLSIAIIYIITTFYKL